MCVVFVFCAQYIGATLDISFTMFLTLHRCGGNTFDTTELIVFDGNTDGQGHCILLSFFCFDSMFRIYCSYLPWLCTQVKQTHIFWTPGRLSSHPAVKATTKQLIPPMLVTNASLFHFSVDASPNCAVTTTSTTTTTSTSTGLCINILTGDGGDGYLTYAVYDKNNGLQDSGSSTYYDSSSTVLADCYDGFDFGYVEVRDENDNAWNGYIKIWADGVQQALSCLGYNICVSSCFSWFLINLLCIICCITFPLSQTQTHTSH